MAISYEKLTVSSSVKTLTVAVYGDKIRATISVEGASLRWTVDGTAPVASTTGHLAEAGDVIELVNSEEICKFKAIREGGTDATIHCSYGL